MRKERLEDARETMTYIKMCESKEMHNQEQADMAKCYLIERHGDWLIKQAERAQELEEEIKTHAPHGRNYTNAQYIELLHENKRYREVLLRILKLLDSSERLRKNLKLLDLDREKMSTGLDERVKRELEVHEDSELPTRAEVSE